jgi:hypothetical protein
MDRDEIDARLRRHCELWDCLEGVDESPLETHSLDEIGEELGQLEAWMFANIEEIGRARVDSLICRSYFGKRPRKK